MERLSNAADVNFKARRQAVEKKDRNYYQPLQTNTVVDKKESFPVQVGQIKYWQGVKLETSFIDPYEGIEPDDTDIHEMEHAVTAEETDPNSVEEISSIPEGNSLGHTTLNRPNIIAGAAPFANHRSGTGYDEVLVTQLGDIHSAAAAAREITTRKRKHITRGAKALHVKRFMTGFELRSELKRVDDGDDVEARIKKPNGEELREIITGVKGEMVMVERKWFEIPERLDYPLNVTPIGSGDASSEPELTIAA